MDNQNQPSRQNIELLLLEAQTALRMNGAILKVLESENDLSVEEHAVWLNRVSVRRSYIDDIHALIEAISEESESRIFSVATQYLH